MDFMTIMGQSTLFRGLPEDELRRLEGIGELREFDKGDMLFQEGREGVGFYVVASGQVKVFKMSFDGREQILHILGPGDPVGEVPVFAGMTYPANAQAMGKAGLYFFPRKKLIELYRESPSLAMNMLAVLSRRLREFTVLIENLSLKEIPQRLATYLVHQQSLKPVSVRVKLNVTKGVLSNILGTSQETLSRVLGKLSQEGFIEVQGKEISILDMERLKSLAEGEMRL
ncbi:Crp/Fnr family transcriptional regulator [Desulfomicrobium escambiense]|uniref:Crp/Fnr family transcriptional regulator n=1 Tax=Desulfomicrobium escambiense TaxID=29503 RepID=UPI0004198CD7|nr:Crp/Fnr family transcriptional regulator [Desulfomicrobium escambiense]